MKTLLTTALILAATQTHAQSNPGEPVWPVDGDLERHATTKHCEIESNECHPPALPIDPCYKPSGGYICKPKPSPKPPTCKPGQVVFGGRCLTPDRQPAKRWCGEDVAPPVVTVALRVFCR